jgi:hypothetical protein
MLAHCQVAEKAWELLPHGPLARLLSVHAEAYRVGAQGPDFLFYSHPWPGQRSRQELALLVHQYSMSATFHSMLEHAASLPDDDRDAAVAFVCGYASHLCLDAVAHPWIMYWTGDITDGAAAEVRDSAFRYHGMLESSIDVILSRGRSDDPGWLRKQDLLRMPEADTTVIATLFERVMADVHGVTFSAEEGRRAFRDMRRIYTAMTDRRTPLARLARGLATFVDVRGLAPSQIYPESPWPVAADLFANRRQWRVPSMPEEPQTRTFLEICDLAVEDTARCLLAIAPVAAGDGEAVTEAVRVIGDRSMFTGVDCGDTRPLVAFAPERDLIWEAGVLPATVDAPPSGSPAEGAASVSSSGAR